MVSKPLTHHGNYAGNAMRTCSKDTQTAFSECTAAHAHTPNGQTTDAKGGGKHLAAVAKASELYWVSMKITIIIAINPLQSKINMYYI